MPRAKCSRCGKLWTPDPKNIRSRFTAKLCQDCYADWCKRWDCTDRKVSKLDEVPNPQDKE